MKIKKLNESSAPSKETLDDCLQDYVNNAFGYDGVQDYVDTQYPMHPQEFKSEVINYLKQNIINESISESISSQEPVVKFTGRSSHTFTKDKKWEIDFDEKGNILARTRKGKPQYFKGHINDKTNSFPSTDEDNIILAAREQHSLKFGKGSAVTESLTESRPDKDYYQNNSTSKVTIKYGNSNKEIQTCKPIKVTNDQLKQYKDNYSFVDIINESKSMSEDTSYEWNPNTSFKHIKDIYNKVKENNYKYVNNEREEFMAAVKKADNKGYKPEQCRQIKDWHRDVWQHNKKNESFDVDKVQKRIARHNEFDNGHVLHDWQNMTSQEAEDKAREASIKNPDDIYYVAYDNIMEPASDIKWKNGKQIEESLNESNINLEDRYNILLAAYGRELRDLMHTNKDGCNDDKIKEMLDKIADTKKKISNVLKEHVEITALEGPKEGPKVGLSSLLTDAIKDEWEAIETYNSLAVTARAEGFEDIANKIDEINTDENTHVGKLQELLKTISPNAEAIELGEDEGKEQLDDINDDMSEDDVLAYTNKYM